MVSEVSFLFTWTFTIIFSNGGPLHGQAKFVLTSLTAFDKFKLLIEPFSNECRKTKTKVITPANHNKHKLPNEPIRTRSKYM